MRQILQGIKNVCCRAVYDNCNEEDVVARDYDEWDMLDTTRSKPLVKPSWCPLVALPEHGRLIDAWELECEFISHDSEYSREQAFDAVKNAPTVLEAST